MLKFFFVSFYLLVKIKNKKPTFIATIGIGGKDGQLLYSENYYFEVSRHIFSDVIGYKL